MGIITKCQLANVTIYDKAQVWVQYENYPPLKASKNFSKKSRADAWIKRTETEIELNPARILHSTTELKHKTLAGFIGQY